MKIRTGFVSNSSSSSFCIYGTTVSKGELQAAIVKTKSIPEDGLGREDEEEFFEKVFDGWYYCYPEGYSKWFIGRWWSDIRDEETGADFKKSIQEKVKEIFGDSKKCETYIETYYS